MAVLIGALKQLLEGLHPPPHPILMDLYPRIQRLIAFRVERVDRNEGLGLHGFHESPQIGGPGVTGGGEGLEGSRGVRTRPSSGFRISSRGTRILRMAWALWRRSGVPTLEVMP